MPPGKKVAMSESFLKKITRKQSFVERAASPYATDIDGCMPVEIDRFEKVGRHVVAVGTDLRSGESVRVFRVWPQSHSRPNPMIDLAQRVTKGGVVMFRGAEKISLPDQENNWACSQHITLISGHSPNEEVEILHGEMTFLDPIVRDARGREGQFYNVVYREGSQLIRDEEEFDAALEDIFATQKPDDTIILRGYSKADGLAASVRLFQEPGETALTFAERFRETNISLNIIGEIETVQGISGAEILSSLSDEDSDMVWELIPVSGFFKTLTARDPEYSRKLQTSGQALYEAFLLPKGGDTMGFRRSTLALKTIERGNGQGYTGVSSLFHDLQPALPLALLDTPHSPDLTAIIPGYREVPVTYADAGDYEEQDLLSALRAEIEKDATDFLAPEIAAETQETVEAVEDAPVAAEPEAPEVAAAEVVDAEEVEAAEEAIDDGLEDLVANALGLAPAPVEDVAEPEVEQDLEPEAVAVEPEAPQEVEPVEDEPVDFLDPDAFPIEEPKEAAPVVEEAVAFEETINLDSFAEDEPEAITAPTPAPEPEQETVEALPEAQAAEEVASSEDDEPFFGETIDLASFDEPAPEVAAPAPAPAKVQEIQAAPEPEAAAPEAATDDSALFSDEIQLDEFTAEQPSVAPEQPKPAPEAVAPQAEDDALFSDEIRLDEFDVATDPAPAPAPSAKAEAAPAPHQEEQPKPEAAAAPQPAPKAAAPAPAPVEAEQEEVSIFGDLPAAPADDGMDFMLVDEPEQEEAISIASDHPDTDQPEAGDDPDDLSDEDIADYAANALKMF